MRDPKQVSAAVGTVTGGLGPISVLVNNAGAPGPAGNDWEVNPDAWWECIESIVRGAFLPERAGSLCLALAFGKYDVLSGWYLTINDDLDAVVARGDEIAAGELYTLRIKI